MDYSQDNMLLVRKELAELLDALRNTAFDANPLQFLLRLEHIRHFAQGRGLTAIAEIAATFEAALQRAAARHQSASIVDNFVAILDDAIGVSHVHPKASEALLASVAIRLGG